MKGLTKHILIAFIIGILVFLVFLGVSLMTTQQFPSTHKLLYLFLPNLAYCVPLYLVNAYGYDLVELYIQKYNKSTLTYFISGTLLSVIWNVITIRIIQFFLYTYVFESDFVWVGENFWNQIILPLGISMTIGLLFFSYHFFKHYYAQKNTQQLNTIARVNKNHQVLQAQIDPHFLFNNLNVLSGLVEENTENAQDFIAELSSVYRYVLHQKDKEWTTLKEELDFAESYIQLIQKRHERGLILEISPALFSMDYYLVPLTLQLLLENCIKHNQIREEEPLIIQVFLEENKLVVKNNLLPKKQYTPSMGVGLSTIKANYAHTPNKVEIDQNNQHFTVKIPLYNQNQIKMNYQDQFSEIEYYEAKKEWEDRVGFYWNLGMYLVICTSFIVFNLYQGGYFWALWPTIGWGIGVVFHAIGVFGPFNNKKWEEKQIRKIMEKRKSQRERF